MASYERTPAPAECGASAYLTEGLIGSHDSDP
jgi:hypothetical protein